MKSFITSLIGLLFSVSLALAFDCHGLGCGGDILFYSKYIDRANIKTFDGGNPDPEQYQLPYDCYSACVMLLAMRNSCVTDYTILNFHSATDLSHKLSKKGSNLIRYYLPWEIQEWADQHHVFDSLIFTSLLGTEAMKLGVQKCKE